MALRSDITDLDHGLAGELLLEVEVVVLHVGRLDVAIKGEDVALEATARGGLKHGALGNDGSFHRAGRKDRSRTYVVIGWARIEERSVGQVAEHHVLREGIV